MKTNKCAKSKKTLKSNCALDGDSIGDSKFKMLLLNARNINKRLELESYVKINGYTIVAVTESWATPDISDLELQLQLEGFVLFRKDRSVVRDGRGGGVLPVCQ